MFDLSKAIQKQQVKPSDVIGKQGGTPPRICAVSGLRMRKPYITYHLPDGYFYRVLAKKQSAWAKATHEAVKTLIPVSGKPVMKSKEVKS